MNHMITRHRAISIFVSLCVVIGLAFGCRSQAPGGAPITPTPLGSIVDQANRMQEENAEPAKFIVYAHEFELNKPFELPIEMASGESHEGVPKHFLRGFRLNQAGQDHVRRLAFELQRGTFDKIVVERSQTSKKWNSLYRYPVNWNAELDEQRRQIIVSALTALGVTEADLKVVVAPAYPFGLDSDEAAQAYQQLFSGGQQNGTNGSGGNQSASGGGGGIGGF